MRQLRYSPRQLPEVNIFIIIIKSVIYTAVPISRAFP